MQDRRVLPGGTDYYVHDEDGRPVLRVDVPSHDTLGQWLVPIATRLREALGDDEQIVLAFDRAGSYADEIATLRDNGVEFVAYERKPYAVLAETAFDHTIEIRGDRYRWCEQRLRNLGKGRGRVRRISLRTGDGHQINLLAHSELGAEDLIGILLGREDKDDPSGRWQQENAFKHGVSRWGINQLDRRSVALYPPDTIIPNRFETSFELDGDLILVAAIVTGQAGRATIQLVLDTGAALTTIAPAVATGIGYSEAAKIVPTVTRTAAADEHGYLVQLVELATLGVNLPAVHVNVADLGYGSMVCSG